MNGTVQISSIVIIFIIGATPVKLLAQEKIDVKEGAFLNSIDWYIKGSLDSINTHQVSKRVTGLNQIRMVVAIQFYNYYDTVTQKFDSGDSYQTIYDRYRFRITLERKQFEDRAPSYYFIRHGNTVVIYTGVEELIYSNHQAFTRFLKDVNPRDPVQIQFSSDGHDIGDYWIEIDKAYEGGFKATTIVYR